MLINVELPTGMTVKVESEWFYSLSDQQVNDFYNNNLSGYEFNQFITNPFNGSVLEEYTPLPDEIDEFDVSIDYTPED